jgi:predicted alpha/beta hydrolase family esterase
LRPWITHYQKKLNLHFQHQGTAVVDVAPLELDAWAATKRLFHTQIWEFDMRTLDYFGDRNGLRTLIVPGLLGSGPQHWQSLWQEEHPEYERVVQKDWCTANLEHWAISIVRQINVFSGPVVLVAHSFGCLAAVLATELAPTMVRGALLVAPANPAKFDVEPLMLRLRMGCPSILVASRNDPWMPYGDAVSWARRWGSRLDDAGNAGHINVPAGYGNWFEGEELLAELRAEIALGYSSHMVSLAA